jgi:hypothetical protein
MESSEAGKGRIRVWLTWDSWRDSPNSAAAAYRCVGDRNDGVVVADDDAVAIREVISTEMKRCRIVEEDRSEKMKDEIEVDLWIEESWKWKGI